MACVRRAVKLRGNHRQLSGVVMRQQALQRGQRHALSGILEAGRRSQSAATVTARTSSLSPATAAAECTSSMMARPAPRCISPCPEAGRSDFPFQFSRYASVIRVSPTEITRPGLHRDTVPSRPVRRGSVSIFMASRISSTSPSAPSALAGNRTFQILPASGAVTGIASAPAGAAAAGAGRNGCGQLADIAAVADLHHKGFYLPLPRCRYRKRRELLCFAAAARLLPAAVAPSATRGCGGFRGPRGRFAEQRHGGTSSMAFSHQAECPSPAR